VSLASKQALADQLRGELSALRVEKEAALHDGHAEIAEAAVDAEIDRLQREVEMAKAETEAVKSGGSVEEALAAMREAAAAEQPDGTVDLAVPLETETNGPVVDEAAVVDATAPVADESTPVVDAIPMPELLAVENNDAPKADGE